MGLPERFEQRFGAVQRYDVDKEILIHPYRHKIEKILKLGCLKKVHNDLYSCLPIVGYNRTVYRLERRMDGNFFCNCQGHKKYNHCSHSEALRLKLKSEGEQLQGSLF